MGVAFLLGGADDQAAGASRCSSPCKDVALRQSQRAGSGWEQLPACLLHAVAGWSRPHSAAMRLACRSWRADVDAMLSHMAPAALPGRMLAAMPSRFPGLRSLDLRRCSALPGPGGLQALGALSGLTSLALPRGQALDGIHLPTSISSLTHLSLQGCIVHEPDGLEAVAGLTGLKVLDVRDLSGEVAGVASAVAGLPMLSELRIGSAGYSSADLEGVLRGCPSSLQALEVSGMVSVEPEAIGLLPRGLISLTLSSALKVSASAVFSLSSLDSLRVLRLPECGEVIGEGMNSGLLSALESLSCLTTLDLSGLNPMTGHELPVLCQLPLASGLTSLDLSGRFGFVDGECLGLGGLPQLRHLNLEGNQVDCSALASLFGRDAVCTHLQTLSLGYLTTARDPPACLSAPSTKAGSLRRLCAHPSSQQALSQLEMVLGGAHALVHLELSNSPCQLEDTMQLAANKLRKLRSLDISTCPRTGDPAVEDISRMPSLTSLTLSHCTALTDSSIGHLSALGALETLDISGCSAISGVCFESWPEGLTNLSKLRASGCRRLQDSCVAALGRLPSLTSLDLSLCRSLSAPVLQALLRRAEGLRELQLTGCDPAVTDELLISTVSQMPSLRRLTVGSCLRLGDNGAAALGRCPTLVDLDISKCPQVSEDGLHWVRCRKDQMLHLEAGGCSVSVAFAATH